MPLLDLSEDCLLGLVLDLELNPAGEVAWPHFHISREVVSVVFSSAYNCEYKVSLSEILALEALADFKYDRHKNEIQQNV